MGPEKSVCVWVCVCDHSQAAMVPEQLLLLLLSSRLKSGGTEVVDPRP